jgi:hypothetical protein
MKLEELREKVGKRALLSVGGYSYLAKNQVDEYKILEISPSQEWVKLLDQNGRRFWKRINEVSLLEFLGDLEPRPHT